MGQAVVRNPDVFLFDEPLSNPDANLRVQMRTEIKSLHQRLVTTIVYVTHDHGGSHRGVAGWGDRTDGHAAQSL